MKKFIYWMPMYPLVGIVGLWVLRDHVVESCLDDPNWWAASAIFQGLCVFVTLALLLS